MRVLLVYPKTPDTFWSFRYALKFINKKAAQPPLGLITVASMLPKDWELRLVDLNIEKLKDKHILWADYIFISAMIVQKQSVREIIKIAKRYKKKIVAGGPLFTTGYEEFYNEIDHFVLNEAEITLPQFLEDLKSGKTKKVYTSDIRPDITKTPLPRWDLIKMNKYAVMPIQYSRGCPFNCEFCDIIIMNGRIPRTKTPEQMISELDALYETGYRGTVFIVDDNFIGNKIKVKQLLPEIINWMYQRKYPFSFTTEASVNLAEDDELLELMVKAGFTGVFLGIESPDENSLNECSKLQNTRINLLDAVKKIQNAGLEVQAGFIVGFDSDKEDIFDRHINFIQKSGIVTAMVSLLCAAPKTRLYERLSKEGRIIKQITGDNTDGSLNFVTKMNRKKLIEGYKKILNTIYHPKEYANRIKTFLQQYKPKKYARRNVKINELMALLKSIWLLGIISKNRRYYWSLFFRGIFKGKFGTSITQVIYGYHYTKMLKKRLNIK